MYRTLTMMVISFLGGCATFEASVGLLYYHRDSFGLDVAGGQGTSTPFSATIGRNQQLGTYVPVAVDASLAPLLATGKPGEDNKALVYQLDTNLKDIFSVFSSFASEGEGEAGKISGKFGNVFATGFAARHLAAAEQARACAGFAQAVQSEQDANAKKILADALTAICGK